MNISDVVCGVEPGSGWSLLARVLRNVQLQHVSSFCQALLVLYDYDHYYHYGYHYS